MSIANLIRRMSELGATPEMIALAVDEIEAVSAALDARRNADRDRKREQRERQKSANVTGQVTPCPSDVTQPPALDKEIPQTPKEINPTPPTRGTRAKPNHALPESWNPAPLKPDGQAGLIAARKPVGWIERELSKFKDHALQKRRLCADWDAAWRNWIKQADEYDGQQRTNGLARNQPSDGLSPTTRAARDVFGVATSH